MHTVTLIAQIETELKKKIPERQAIKLALDFVNSIPTNVLKDDLEVRKWLISLSRAIKRVGDQFCKHDVMSQTIKDMSDVDDYENYHCICGICKAEFKGATAVEVEYNVKHNIYIN